MSEIRKGKKLFPFCCAELLEDLLSGDYETAMSKATVERMWVHFATFGISVSRCLMHIYSFTIDRSS